MNVMHDGDHGAYSNKSWVNKLMGGSIYILAGNVYNWQVQHNVLHHTYTNIPGHDEDLDAGRIILAADSLGASSTLISKAVEYSKERRQFGRTIGSFQAVNQGL